MIYYMKTSFKKIIIASIASLALVTQGFGIFRICISYPDEFLEDGHCEAAFSDCGGPCTGEKWQGGGHCVWAGTVCDLCDGSFNVQVPVYSYEGPCTEQWQIIDEEGHMMRYCRCVPFITIVPDTYQSVPACIGYIDPNCSGGIEN